MTVGSTVVQGDAYVFSTRLRGVGGLPVGSASRVVSLLSAGIDSPVATWRMMRRGAVVVGVHFSGRPQTVKRSRAPRRRDRRGARAHRRAGPHLRRALRRPAEGDRAGVPAGPAGAAVPAAHGSRRRGDRRRRAGQGARHRRVAWVRWRPRRSRTSRRSTRRRPCRCCAR